MNLTELQDEVIGITGRPDLSDRILSAIRNSTLKAHRSDFYTKDKILTVFDTGDESYEKQVSTLVGFVRFRKLSFARIYDNSAQTYGPQFDPIDPENMDEEDGIPKPYICFEAGDHYIFRSKTKFQYIYVCYFQDPIITTDGFASWIAIHNPWAIIHEAAAQVFRQIGQIDKFKAQRDLASDEYALLRVQHIQSIGY